MKLKIEIFFLHLQYYHTKKLTIDSSSTAQTAPISTIRVIKKLKFQKITSLKFIEKIK